MGCCGQKSGQKLEYVVKLNNGQTKTVESLAAAKLAVATGGGGTYRAVVKK
jgi:hypothetical protein